MKKIYLISIVGIFVILGIGFWLWQNYEKKPGQIQKVVLVDIVRNLNADQQKIYEDRIQKAKDFLNSLDSTKSDYKLQQINTYSYLAQQYQGLGKLQLAIEFYDKALLLEPNHEQLKVGKALVLIEGGKLEEANILFKQTLERNKKNPDVWLRYISLRKSLNDTNEQINTIYTEALLGTERAVDIVTSNAQFQEQLGNIKDSIQLWEEAVKANPINQDLYLSEIRRLKKIN